MGKSQTGKGEAVMTDLDDYPAPQWFGEIWEEFRAASLKATACRDIPPRQRKVRLAPPDGLRTLGEAAAKLGCSIKTLNGHVAAGDLRYVIIGRGTKRPRKMFTDSDINAFIAAQTRKDFPCPSTAPAKRLTGILTSNTVVIGFTARRNARLGVKPKK
jgi:hypothetical protein